MSANYTKLKDYLNENKSSPSSSTSFNGLNDAKNTVFDFFSKRVLRNDFKQSNIQIDSKLSDDQTDSWFKEADTDPYCPKLVNINL